MWPAWNYAIWVSTEHLIPLCLCWLLSCAASNKLPKLGLYTMLQSFNRVWRALFRERGQLKKQKTKKNTKCHELHLDFWLWLLIAASSGKWNLSARCPQKWNALTCDVSSACFMCYSMFTLQDDVVVYCIRYSRVHLDVGGTRFSSVHRRLAQARVTEGRALKFCACIKSPGAHSAHRSISSQILSPENGSSLSMRNHAGITTGYESCALSAALCLQREICVPSRDSDL